MDSVLQAKQLHLRQLMRLEAVLDDTNRTLKTATPKTLDRDLEGLLLRSRRVVDEAERDQRDGL